MSTRNIYKITNKVNGKIYIGKTIKKLDTRFGEHICTAKRWNREQIEGKKHPYNSRLYPAMNKYGYDKFEISLVEALPETDISSLDNREKYWISYYNSTDSQIGYNISPGGMGGPLFKGHKHSNRCKQAISKRTKNIPQDAAFIRKRSYARARLMQNLTTGKVISILDLSKGYFYEQTITNYRIYKSDNNLYACLEQPHNRLPELTLPERQELLIKLKELIADRHESCITALHEGRKNISDVKCKRIAESLSITKQEQRKQRLEQFLFENNIDKDEYKQLYIKYKENCPNKHLELIYNIPYSKVRDLNKYLGLFGGGSGHAYGKINIEENNR